MLSEVNEALTMWDASRTHADEQGAANTIRQAKERFQQVYDELHDPEGQSLEIHKAQSKLSRELLERADTIQKDLAQVPQYPDHERERAERKAQGLSDAAKQEYAAASGKLDRNGFSAKNGEMTEREKLELSRQIATAQLNRLTYLQHFIGITSPVAAGVEGAQSRLTGNGAEIEAQNVIINGITGNWLIHPDGSSVLVARDGSDRLVFRAEGLEVGITNTNLLNYEKDATEKRIRQATDPAIKKALHRRREKIVEALHST